VDLEIAAAALSLLGGVAVTWDVVGSAGRLRRWAKQGTTTGNGTSWDQIEQLAPLLYDLLSANWRRWLGVVSLVAASVCSLFVVISE
jgi:hypothetical protein